jgi:hypothetical protein
VASCDARAKVGPEEFLADFSGTAAGHCVLVPCRTSCLGLLRVHSSAEWGAGWEHSIACRHQCCLPGLHHTPYDPYAIRRTTYDHLKGISPPYEPRMCPIRSIHTTYGARRMAYGATLVFTPSLPCTRATCPTPLPARASPPRWKTTRQRLPSCRRRCWRQRRSTGVNSVNSVEQREQSVHGEKMLAAEAEYRRAGVSGGGGTLIPTASHA